MCFIRATYFVKMWTTKKLEAIPDLLKHSTYEELLTIHDKYLDLPVTYYAMKKKKKRLAYRLANVFINLMTMFTHQQMAALTEVWQPTWVKWQLLFPPIVSLSIVNIREAFCRYLTTQQFLKGREPKNPNFIKAKNVITGGRMEQRGIKKNAGGCSVLLGVHFPYSLISKLLHKASTLQNKPSKNLLPMWWMLTPCREKLLIS